MGAAGRCRRDVVLIVEDDPNIRTALAEVLDEYGYETLTECDGEAALELLDNLPPASDDAPSVILVDVMMPGMSGYEFVAALRVRPAAASVPVIFMSAGPRPWWRSEDGHRFLDKPLRIDRLLAAIRNAAPVDNTRLN